MTSSSVPTTSALQFKTAAGGDGAVTVGDFISFRDPDHRIGFPIVNDGTASRLLTGGDLDPESLQRGRDGDLWMGDEFGPWILHFSSTGVLLDPPFAMPDGIRSPNNPFLNGAPPTHPNSRGLEGMAITPDRKHLYAALEGATLADPDPYRRHVYEFDTESQTFTGRVLQYRTEAPGNLVADMWAVDTHRLVVIERDLGSGLNARFRRIYLIDLRVTDPAGFLVKTQLVDLTAIPDPDQVSLPALHPGDVGLGDPVLGHVRVGRGRPPGEGEPAHGGLRQQPAELRPQPCPSRRQRVHPRGRPGAEKGLTTADSC